MSTSTNHFGGRALLGGGILFTIAGILHPEVSTLEGANVASPGLWALVHWAYLIGDVLLVAGLVTLFRHVAFSSAGSNAGWAAVALAGGVMGFTLDGASTGIHMLAFPPAVPASTPNLQNIFDAAAAVNTGIGNAGFLVACLGLVALGAVMKKEGWSPVVAIGGMAVGGIEVFLAIVTGITGSPLIPAGSATLAVNALMPVSYAVVGVFFGKVKAE